MLKKLTCIALVALMIVSMLPISAMAAVTWGYDGKGNLTISGSGAMTNYSASSPAPWAKYANAVTNVRIISGVTSIGNDAFAGMNSLRSVTIPASVTTIGNYAFYRCDSLPSVALPSALTSIGDYAFYGCDGLTTVSIPATVTTLGESAFADCSNLATLTIGSGVTKIGSYAFFDCDSLTNVTIPASVATMGTRPFEDCDSLTGFTVASGNTAFATDSTGTLYTADMTTLIRVPNVHSGSFTVPATVTTIKPYAFFGCESITVIQLPASVSSVDKESFGHCASLEGIQVAADNAAFCNDESGVLYNKDKTCLYRAPEKITGSYVIPDSVSTISTHAFDGCVGLTEVTMNETAAVCPEGIFEGCTGLKKVTFPGNAPTIHEEAFWGVTADVSYSPYHNWTESQFANYGGTLNWVPSHIHEYTSTYHEATCQEYAKIEYFCESCGHSYTEYTGSTMSEWMESLPEDLDENVTVETKEQYRFSEVTTITSFAPVLDGYTQTGSAWVQAESGTVNYVESWPSGFDTTNALYAKYNNLSSKVTASETDSVKTVVNSDGATGYLWYHWCSSSAADSRKNETGTYTTFHAFVTETMDYMDYNGEDGSYQIVDTCGNSEWYWFVKVYTQEYSTSRLQYTHEGWSEWSQWSDTAVTASDTCKVETRTMYRCVRSELGDHKYVDGLCSVCGTPCTHAWENGVCSVCGSVCAHTWSSGSCTVCGSTCAHDWTNGICGTCGLPCAHTWVNGSCSVCGKICSHTWSNGACTTCGKTCSHTWNNGICSVCGKACVHNYSNGACTICGKACVHNWTDGVCGTCGQICNHTYASGTCTNCGMAEPVVLPVLTPAYATLALEEEVKYNFYFKATNLGDLTVSDMGLVTFKTKVEDGSVENADAVIHGATFDGTNYMVQSQGVPAKELGDNMYFRAYVKMSDGTYVYSKMVYYSAVTYVNSTLKKTTASETLKQTCVALLNYGASAQEYFGYKTDSLMNAGLTAEQQALVAPYSSDMTMPVVKADSSKTSLFTYTADGFTQRYPSVSLEGAFAINYYFKPAYEPTGKMTFYYWDAETYSSVSILTQENAIGSKVMVKDDSGKYVAAYDSIAAKALDETVYVAAVYEANGTRYCTGVLAYSVAASGVSQMQSGDANQKNLAENLLVYGYYAKEYFKAL